MEKVRGLQNLAFQLGLDEGENFEIWKQKVMEIIQWLPSEVV